MIFSGRDARAHWLDGRLDGRLDRRARTGPRPRALSWAGIAGSDLSSRWEWDEIDMEAAMEKNMTSAETR